MKLLSKYIFSLFLFYVSNVSANFTGFVEDNIDLKPVSQSYNGDVPDIYIDNPDDAIILMI